MFKEPLSVVLWMIQLVSIFAAESDKPNEVLESLARASKIPVACRKPTDSDVPMTQKRDAERKASATTTLSTILVAQGGSQRETLPIKDDRETVTTLKATYFFDCGISGSHSRRFTWSARFEPGQGLLLTALLNIDSFVDVEANVPVRGQFRAAFTNVWDIAYSALCCRFYASGHFEGTVYADTIAMDFITLSGPVNRRPFVSEDCTVHGARRVVRMGHPCTVTYVNVEVL